MMKNVLILLIVVFLLIACGSQQDVASTQSTPPGQTLTWTPMPSSTIAPTATHEPTATLEPTPTAVPFPPVISAENLEQIEMLYRFESGGFYVLNDWVVLDDNQQTTIWDLRTANQLAIFDGRQKGIQGDYILIKYEQALALYRVSSGEQLLSFEGAEGLFHPIEPWLLIFGTQTGFAQLWNYQTGEMLGEFVEFPEDDFVFSSGGGILASSGGKENNVRVWQLPDMQLTHQLDDHVMIFNRNLSISITDDERFLIVPGSSEHKIFDLETDELIWLDTKSWMVYPGLESRYAFVTTDATTRVYDMVDRQFIKGYLIGDSPAFFPEENLITNYDNSWVAFHLYVYENGSFDAVTTIYMRDGVYGNGSFYSKEDLFVAVDQSRKIRFYRQADWEEIFQFVVPEAYYVSTPRFSQGGHWLTFSWSAPDGDGKYNRVFEVWGIPE